MKKTIVYFIFCMVLPVVTLSGCASVASTISPTSTSLPWEAGPTPIPGYTVSPDWLPDGEIAFSVVKEPHTVSASGLVMSVGASVLYLVHTDGTGLVQLADGPDPWNEASAWSPDGTRIIYGTGS